MSNDITVAFGRFNPPTIGREKDITAEKVAQVETLRYIYQEHRMQRKSIDPDMKVSYMRKMSLL